MKAGAGLTKLMNAIDHLVDDLLANRVMATSIVVGRILVGLYLLFGMDLLTLGCCADLIENSWVEF